MALCSVANRTNRMKFRYAGIVALGSLAAHVVSAGVAHSRRAEQDAMPVRGAGPDMAIPALTARTEPEQRLKQKGMRPGSPVMIRIFKAESELEVWVGGEDHYELFATYPICFWSGTLGPKLREGDRQAPEGLYSVGTDQLRPTGRRPRSFDIGYPNNFDRAAGRGGSAIWVHGGCGSRGCFAMTNPVMDEIYALGEQALAAGQDRFQVQVFPFRMTHENMTLHADSRWSAFWANLKEAYDAFERTRVPPRVSMCGQRYVVEEGAPGGPSSTAVAQEPLSLPETPPNCGEIIARPLPALRTATRRAATKATRRRKAARAPRSRRIAVHRARHASAQGRLR